MLMSVSLYERLDPWRLADRRAVLDGSLDIRDLPRLRDLVLRVAGDVIYKIWFERDEQDRILVRGTLVANLVLECQRCLEPLSFPVAAEFALVAVKGLDEVRLLPEQYEPLMVEEGMFRPLELIEEELLLALPQIPKHADRQCRLPLQAEVGDAGSPAHPLGVGREKPFACLAGLKRKIKH